MPVDVLVKQGRITAPTSGYARVDVDVTEVGFRPKVVLFWWSGRFGDGTGTNARIGFGAADAAGHQFAAAMTSMNTKDVPDTAAVQSTNACVWSLKTSTGQRTYALLLGMLDNGFRIRWAQSFGGAFDLNYVALGGDDLEAHVGNFNIPLVTGLQAVAGVGFEPDALIFAGVSSPSTNGTPLVDARFGMGFATASDEGAFAVTDEDTSGSGNAEGNIYQRYDRAIVHMTHASSSREAQLDSLDADGFALDWTSVDGNASKVLYVALKSAGGIATGMVASPTSPGTDAVSGLGFEPGQLLFAGVGDETPGSPAVVATDCRVAIGGATASFASSVGIWSEDGAATSVTRQDEQSSAIHAIENGNLVSPWTDVVAEADVSVFGPDGFTLDWTAADSTAREFLYLAIEATVDETEPPDPPPPVILPPPPITGGGSSTDPPDPGVPGAGGGTGGDGEGGGGTDTGSGVPLQPLKQGADWISIPVFTGPITKFERTGAQVKIEAQGKESLLLAPCYQTHALHIPRRTRVDDAIRRLLRRKGERKFAIPELVHEVNGKQIPDRIHEHINVGPQMEPWKVLTGGQQDAHGKHVPSLLSYAHKHYRAFYDGLGFLRVRRKRHKVMHEFTAVGENATVIGQPTVTFDVLSEFRNTVRVRGKQLKGTKHHVHAFVHLHADHPLSPHALARNGEPRYIVEFVDAPGLKTHADCVKRAREVLRRKSHQGLTASFETLPYPMLEEHDRVRLRTEDYHLDFELRTFSIPLTSDGTMTIGFGHRANPKRKRIRRHRRRR